jgi:hypothetical protein
LEVRGPGVYETIAVFALGFFREPVHLMHHCPQQIPEVPLMLARFPATRHVDIWFETFRHYH